jgi:tetratricopeptide (TPR) repeat protein
MAEELGLDELRAHVLVNIGSARCNGGDFGGIADLEHGIEIAEAIGSPEASRAYNNLGAIHEMTGDLRRHRALREQALRVGERFGAHRLTNFSRVAAANAAYPQGRWNDFVRFAHAHLAERTRSRYQDSYVRSYLGEIALARGDERTAVEEADAALRHAREAKDLQVVLPALASGVFVLAEAGRPDDAQARLDELLELVGETLWSHEAIAEAALVADRIDRLTDVRAAVQRLTPETRWLAAGRAALEGDFARAGNLFDEIGTLPLEAFARLRAGTDDQVRRALAFYRSVGATRYIGEGEALLAASA